MQNEVDEYEAILFAVHQCM